MPNCSSVVYSRKCCTSLLPSTITAHANICSPHNCVHLYHWFKAMKLVSCSTAVLEIKVELNRAVGVPALGQPLRRYHKPQRQLFQFTSLPRVNWIESRFILHRRRIIPLLRPCCVCYGNERW